MKKMNSLLVKGFQASKCKTQLRLGTSRIKLLRNKKLSQIASDRKGVAEFLRNGQENNARLLVEHVIMEQDLIEAYDLLYLYAERIAAQLSVIDSQKTCPPDLKEDISTLLYASSRCAELTDFAQIRPMFVAKYGKEFVSAAIELRSGCGVNGKVIEKLSVNGATGETKLKLMKDIAAEHNVNWDPAPFEREIRADRDDVLRGPTAITEADTSSVLLDDFPSVPNQKPTLETRISPPKLETRISPPKDPTNPTLGRFAKDNVEPTNSPRPGDYRKDLPGAFPKMGPPSRKPPGRDQSRAEDMTFNDRHPDMDLGSRETQSQRNQRRESDSFLAPSSQARHQVEESRRNSIGVPREKSVRGHTGSAHADMDEPLPQDYKKHNQRDSQGAGIDDFDEGSHRKGSHGREFESGFDGRPNQKFAGKEGSASGRPQYEDQYAEEDNHRRAASREGSGRGRPQYEDQHAEEDNLRRAASSEGSGRGRPQYEDHYAGEDNLRRGEGSGRGRPQYEDHHAEEDNLRRGEGSGRGRPRYEDQHAEEDNLRKTSSKEGSRGKTHLQETLVDEGSRGRISVRGKEDKLFSGKNRKQDYSDEDADRVPHRSEEPRRRESTSNTPKYLDEDKYNPAWDDEHFRNSVTTRIPRNSEDHEYRDSGKSSQRDSLNMRFSVEDMSRKSNNLAVPKKEIASYPSERTTFDTPHYDSSEDEYDSRRGGARKPEPRYNNFKASDSRTLDRSSESGEEGSRKGTRRTPGLTSIGEQRRDHALDDQGSSRGKRYPVKASGRPDFDYDDQVDSDEDHFTTSSRTTNDLSHTEKRMSLPGGSVHEKVKYQGNRPYDDHDDSVRRRATMGPEEIRQSSKEEIRRSSKETEDPPRSWYGEREREKQVDSRRLSAPISKVMQEDVMEGRHSQRDKTDRHRKAGVPAVYDDDRPRFSPQVGLQDDDEYLPSTRTQRERSDRQQKPDIPPRYDDGRPPPRFIKVGNQPNLDDEDLRPSLGFKGEKPQRFVNSPRLTGAKTEPELRKTSVPAHRKSNSAFADSSSSKASAAPAARLQKPSPEETQSPKPAGQKPTFLKPPDLDSLFTMFGKNPLKK